jgi:hypothetical protein
MNVKCKIENVKAKGIMGGWRLGFSIFFTYGTQLKRVRTRLI